MSSSDNQLAALREEIRRAGRVTHQDRSFAVGCVGIALLLLAATAFAAGGWVWGLIMLGLGAAAGLLFALSFAFPLAALSRWVRSQKLRVTLAKLPPAQQAEILAPLRSENHDDSRKIAASLIRNLRLYTEITPAPTPPGRGDEPSPAET